jgi:hypothetical protein
VRLQRYFATETDLHAWGLPELDLGTGALCCISQCHRRAMTGKIGIAEYLVIRAYRPFHLGKLVTIDLRLSRLFLDMALVDFYQALSHPLLISRSVSAERI